jgi:ATP adenylyltransferase/5',5'''-P-1,P-4-tetraphosphate phosphorylase II
VKDISTFQAKVMALIHQQIADWKLATRNYDGLKNLEMRNVLLDNDVLIRLQFNAERIYSSSAKVDTRSISERPCFLCDKNRPAEQEGLAFGDRYQVLVNPFPISSHHLTIVERDHLDQRISGRIDDMLDLAEALESFVIFYNGPKCGASAPDHFHFQAIGRGMLPVETDLDDHPLDVVLQNPDLYCYFPHSYHRKTLVLEGKSKKAVAGMWERAFSLLKKLYPNEPEPMVNVLASYSHGKHRLIVFPRGAHRPPHYFEDGEGQILLSPASVDFGGVLVVPRHEDFIKLTPETIADIFQHVSLDDKRWVEFIGSLKISVQ